MTDQLKIFDVPKVEKVKPLPKMKKLKRTPCSLGWTDHALRRLSKKLKEGGQWNFPLRKTRKRRRYVSPFNEIFHRESKGIPF